MLSCTMEHHPEIWTDTLENMTKIVTVPEVAKALQLIIMGARPHVIELTPIIAEPCNHAFCDQYQVGATNTAAGILTSSIETANKHLFKYRPTPASTIDEHWKRKIINIIQENVYLLWKTYNAALHTTNTTQQKYSMTELKRKIDQSICTGITQVAVKDCFLFNPSHINKICKRTEIKYLWLQSFNTARESFEHEKDSLAIQNPKITNLFQTIPPSSPEILH